MTANTSSPPLDGTSLDTKETTEEQNSNQTYADFRRDLCKDEWQAAGQVYSFTDSRDSRDRYSQYTKCRTDAWFARNTETGRVTVLSNACHLRWCPICHIGLKKFIEVQTLDWLKQQFKPKIITLTLRHSDAPLMHQINSLYKFFRKLRHEKVFKTAVYGGIWFFQVTFNKEHEQWHPHLHMLVNAKYIPQKNLASMWLSITGTSNVVDIRMVRNTKQATDYVARYATSPCKMDGLLFNRQLELFDAMHKRRICGGFGSAKHIKVRTQPPADKGKWKNIGSWWTVTRLASSEPFAGQILSAWQAQTELAEDVTMTDVDRALAGEALYEEELAEPPPLKGLYDQY